METQFLERATLEDLCALSVDDLHHLCLARKITAESKEDRLDALLALSADRSAMSLDSFAQRLSNISVGLKVIFLDVDGVLNTKSNMYHLDARCMTLLVQLVRDTTARIVLSSTWRLQDYLKLQLWRTLVCEGLPREQFIGQTPDLNESSRDLEIADWLARARQRVHVTSWVVLDDMDLSECKSLRGHFVLVDPSCGLSAVDTKRALEILQKVPPYCCACS